MTGRAWAIKLGSGGRCVKFCERHQIVGVGWKEIPAELLTSSRSVIADALMKSSPGYYDTRRKAGGGAGQLHRFAREVQIGDYVVYYDPPRKMVRIARVTSDVLRRDFELDDNTDIWHYRRVEYPVPPIPRLDFYGGLMGQLLGPQMSFWELKPFDAVDQLAKGLSPHVTAAPDPEIHDAYANLQRLVLRRLDVLNDSDWERLVVDYFRAQGAFVDERAVGGSRPVIDLEARFEHGDLGAETWRVQVKHHRGRQFDWPAIESDFANAGAEARFCFVSVSGFTARARERAEEEGVRLFEAEDFVPFVLTGKVRAALQRKLQLPFFGGLRPPEADSASGELEAEDIASPRERSAFQDVFAQLRPPTSLEEGTPVTNLAWRIARSLRLGARVRRTYERPGEGERIVGFVFEGTLTAEDRRKLTDAVEAGAGAALKVTVSVRPTPDELQVDDAQTHEAAFSGAS